MKGRRLYNTFNNAACSRVLVSGIRDIHNLHELFNYTSARYSWCINKLSARDIKNTQFPAVRLVIREKWLLGERARSYFCRLPAAPGYHPSFSPLQFQNSNIRARFIRWYCVHLDLAMWYTILLDPLHMHNLHLLEFIAEDFWCHVNHQYNIIFLRLPVSLVFLSKFYSRN